MTLSLKYKGFDYVDYYNGGYANADSLPALAQTGANAIEASLQYGIDPQTDLVYADSSYTDSQADLGAAIKQAVGLGLQVMVRPLIDFLNPADLTNTPYSVGEWRSYFNPGAAGSATANTFFLSYQTMILQEAATAAANGATSFSIGTELDQITGPAYKSYWDSIISALRADDPSLKLTYSADWDDALSPWTQAGTGLAAGTGNLATQVSFASELDSIGVDCYAPISNLANPTLAQLVAGWTQTPVNSGATATTHAVTGNQSLISYFESVATAVGKPLIFTELGYEDATDADTSPSGTATDTLDATLQSNLYQAFFNAWQQAGNSSLTGVYFWNWDPNAAEVGGNGVNFSPQGEPALTVVTNEFSSGPVVVAETNIAGVAGYMGSPSGAHGAAGIGASVGALAGDTDSGALAATLTITAIVGGVVGASFATAFGSLDMNANGSYSYFATNNAKLQDAPTGAPVTDQISFTVTDGNGASAQSTLTISDYRDPTVKSGGETDNVVAGQTISATAGPGGTGALSGDFDPDGVALAVDAIDNVSQQLANPIAGRFGTLTLNSDGSYSYTADSQTSLAAAFAANNGAPLEDGFSLLVFGGDGTFTPATLTIAIDPAIQPAVPDFTGNGMSDLLLLNTNGALAQWDMNGVSVAGGGVFSQLSAGWSVAATGDFNGDGKSDLLLQNGASLAEWLMNGTQIIGGGYIDGMTSILSPGWSVAGAGDFNGDGKADILLQSGGALAEWLMNGAQVVGGGNIDGMAAILSPGWSVAGIGDFNGDGKSDLLLQDPNGNGDTTIADWLMNGTQVSGGGIIATLPTGWSIAGVGDFNGDGKADLLLQHAANGVVDTLAEWLMNGSQVVGGGDINGVADNLGGGWSVGGVGDFNGDGKADILLKNANGAVAEWLLNGTNVIGGGAIGTVSAPWSVP